MLQRLIPLLFILLPWSLYPQNSDFKRSETNGHVIGESISELLSKEPEVRQKVTVCEHTPHKSSCDNILAAIKIGQRAEVSTSNWMSFVLEGGKLVKLTTLVHGGADTVKADLSKEFGDQTSETPFPMQNAMGAKWEDHQSVWDLPAVYVGLHEDNNPASQNHHLVLVIESREEHARENTEAEKQ